MKNIIEKLLLFQQKFEVSCILLSNKIVDKYGKYEIIAGFDVLEETTNLQEIKLDENEALWLGNIAYDYKNEIENLQSKNNSYLYFENCYFFRPKYFFIKEKNGTIITNIGFEEIESENLLPLKENINFNFNTEKENYIQSVESIKEKIVNGVFYEMNFCQQFSSSYSQEFSPEWLFLKYNDLNPAPFGAFYKFNNNYLICESPERFIQKTGNKILSQPIKGTRKRGLNFWNDLAIRRELKNSEKDRAENVMIVDLVRNDLSKICKVGTVKVPELMRIYSFKFVHQMISTIEGVLTENITFKEIIHALFPMGSMTGAPKIEVMKHIDLLENFKRNLYSGTIGYIFKSDFDFNVVIRSIQVNTELKTMVSHAGGAIVYDSNAEKEWEECMVKQEAMNKVLCNN